MRLLNEKHLLSAAELRETLELTRARVHQLIVPLIKKGLVKSEGKARATTYQLTDRRSPDQIRRENWGLRKKVQELERTLEDRKVIEQAKEVLTAQFGILPTEAYRKLQQQSMDSGRSMREIADSILAAYQLM